MEFDMRIAMFMDPIWLKNHFQKQDVRSFLTIYMFWYTFYFIIVERRYCFVLNSFIFISLLLSLKQGFEINQWKSLIIYIAPPQKKKIYNMSPAFCHTGLKERKCC